MQLAISGAKCPSVHVMIPPKEELSQLNTNTASPEKPRARVSSDSG